MNTLIESKKIEHFENSNLENDRTVLISELRTSIDNLKFEVDSLTLLLQEVSELGSDLGYNPQQVIKIKRDVSSKTASINESEKYLKWVHSDQFMTNSEIRRIVMEHVAKKDLLYDYEIVSLFMDNLYGSNISRKHINGWGWMPISPLTGSWTDHIHPLKFHCLKTNLEVQEGDISPSGVIIVGCEEPIKNFHGDYHHLRRRGNESYKTLPESYEEEIPIFALREAKEIKDLIWDKIQMIANSPTKELTPIFVAAHPLYEAFSKLNMKIADDEREIQRQKEIDPFMALYLGDGLPPIVFSHWNEPGFDKVVSEGKTPSELKTDVKVKKQTKINSKKKESIIAFSVAISISALILGIGVILII